MARGAKDKNKKPLAVMNKYVYDAFLWTFSILVELFFREVHPRSSWKVPKEGPVIFVCAPHANQVRLEGPVCTHPRTTDLTSLSTL
jgi:glycerol-3-phosphate O-acyltransferase/dihydroxyacetone phosphate acyltransferase